MLSKNTIIACVSNLSTAYNLIVINIVHVLVQNQYCGGDKCKDEVSVASTACLVGAIAGQLTFGYVGDCIGRSAALQLTMAFSILGALVSAFAVPLSPEHPETVFTFLAITRFILGLGVGGVYPLSATIASESAGSAASRGTTASIVFSMQGIGSVTVPIVALICVALFGNPPHTDPPTGHGLSWRLTLAFGALPGILLAPFKANETGQRRAQVVAAEGVDSSSLVVNAPAEAGGAGGGSGGSGAGDSGVSGAAPAPRPTLTLGQALCMRAYWGKLVGCAGGWLLFDITFYGNSLFQASVLEHIFNATSTTAPVPVAGDVHTNRAIQMLLIALIGLPGYYVAVGLMDRIGRRNMQMQGFFFMAVTFGVLGLGLHQLEGAPGLMLFVYGLTFFFSNFGPNSTTFILPAETFPAHLRTTLNGFCAACGKLGATIGSAAFKPLSQPDVLGLGNTMVLCAAVSLAGLLLTFAFVEDRRGKGMEGDHGPTPLIGSEGNSSAPNVTAATEDGSGRANARKQSDDMI